MPDRPRDPNALAAWISFSFMTVLAWGYVVAMPLLHAHYAPMFADFNVPLPLLTRIVYGVHGLVYSGLALMVFVLGLILMLTLPKKVARFFSRIATILFILLTIPIVLATVMPMITLITGASSSSHGR